MLAPLPVNFIPYRGFFLLYLPLIGWSLYFATGLVLLRTWLAGSRSRLGDRAERAPGRDRGDPVRDSGRPIIFSVSPHPTLISLASAAAEEFIAAHPAPAMPHEGGVLFVNDAWDGDTLEPLFISSDCCITIRKSPWTGLKGNARNSGLGRC